MAAVGTMLGAQVPADWPPGEYDRAAIEFMLAELSSTWPEKDGWSAWYAVRNADAAHAATLIGAGGYFGPPDTHGSLEIGFSISAPWRRNGFAREMVRALLWRAAQSGLVRLVQAHTRLGNDASISVLRSSGFEPAAADEPGLLRFEYPISAP